MKQHSQMEGTRELQLRASWLQCSFLYWPTFI